MQAPEKKQSVPNGGKTMKMKTKNKTHRADPLHLFDLDLKSLPDLFRDFDEAMEHRDPPELRPRLRLVYPEGTA